MARIKYTAIVDQIEGSIGGTTFQKNQYGFSVRRKPNMTNPNRTLQERQKPIIANATRAWRGMTSTQRDAWATFASNNPQAIHSDPNVAMSGYAVFVRLNVFRQLSGMSLYTSAPNITVPSITASIFAIASSPGSNELDVTPMRSGDTGSFEGMLYLSSPLGEGLSVIRNRLRYMATETMSTVNFQVGTEYLNVFGQIAPPFTRIGAQIIMFVPDNGWVERTSRDIFEVGEL